MTLEQQIQQAEKHLKNLRARLAQVNALRSHFGNEYDTDQTNGNPRYKFIGYSKDGHKFSLLYETGDSYIEFMDKRNRLPDVDKDYYGIGFIHVRDIKKHFRRSR
tara:strand:- start:142 stop:456 length:315 start_codon:yes stop_codon:yes gene_type:complete